MPDENLPPEGATPSEDLENQETIIEDTDLEVGIEPEPGETTPEEKKLTPEEEAVKQHQINQAKVNKVINKKHRKMMEATEALEKEKQANATLQNKINELQKVSKPVIPPIPEAYDPEYQNKMKDRDEAIRKSVQYTQNVQSVQQQQQQNQQEQFKKQQEVTTAKINGFRERVSKLGIKPDELLVAETTVASYIPDQNVRDFLLEDANGPLIIQYLADNPLELQEVASMSPILAGIHLKEAISPKALKLAPKQTTTPDPAPLPGGRKAPAVSRPMIAGATFT